MFNASEQFLFIVSPYGGAPVDFTIGAPFTNMA